MKVTKFENLLHFACLVALQQISDTPSFEVEQNCVTLYRKVYQRKASQSNNVAQRTSFGEIVKLVAKQGRVEFRNLPTSRTTLFNLPEVAVLLKR